MTAHVTVEAVDEVGRLCLRHAGCEVAVRFAPDSRGRLLPVEVTVASGEGVAAEALRTLPLRAIEAAANRVGADGRALTEPVRRPKLNLAVPAGPGRKPDEFYRRVAEAHSYLAVLGRAPATALAELNGVPVTTVHRWVKEARARGLLAPGQKGRAT